MRNQNAAEFAFFEPPVLILKNDVGGGFQERSLGEENGDICLAIWVQRFFVD